MTPIADPYVDVWRGFTVEVTGGPIGPLPRQKAKVRRFVGER
jgi:hypothetical protein